MQQERLKFKSSYSVKFMKWAALAVLGAGCIAPSSMAQKAGQKKFPTAQDAADALVAAAQANDESALLAIFGQDGKQVVSSGDATEDAESRANFVKRYNEMHRLVKEPDGTTSLYVGSENWPLPIPLVNKGNSWYFDTAAGKREVLYRRVGRNEMSTIHVCLELVAAQKEYYSSHDSVYAQKIFSDEGQQNGLYWKVPEGQPQSPIGPLVASAVAEGYTPGQDSASHTPYRGYLYRVLTGQGPAAPGGAKPYVADGKMTGGFAFLAYPAEYRSSGVMTFLVGEDGVVYSKDLGKNTATIAKALKQFNPDSSWKKEAP
jgi:hypothetical protein